MYVYYYRTYEKAVSGGERGKKEDIAKGHYLPRVNSPGGPVAESPAGGCTLLWMCPLIPAVHKSNDVFGSVLTVDITMDAGMPQFFMAVISAIFCGFLPIYVLIVWTSPFYNGNIAQ